MKKSRDFSWFHGSETKIEHGLTQKLKYKKFNGSYTVKQTEIEQQ